MPEKASWKDALDPFQRMDIEREEREHALALADEDRQTKLAVAREETRRVRSQHRKEALGLVLIAALAALLLYGGYLWFIADDGSPSDDETFLMIEERREQSCIDDGGGYVPGDVDLNVMGSCVFPGETVGE